LVERMNLVGAVSPAAVHRAANFPLGAKLAGVAPVLLHAGWRTRGTWIWSRFRALPDTACFYEPLYEDLATLSRSTMEQYSPTAWRSGHPPLRRPYFDEYRPLLHATAHGVRRHEANFATAGFFAEPDAALPGLRDYLALLLQTAQGADTQPVLKFCRSLGRVGWMQQNFPAAIHIAVARNPLAQFVSALRHFQGCGDTYFLAMPLLLLAMHRDVPDVAAAIRHLAPALPALPCHDALEPALAACTAHLRDSGPEQQYRGFLAFWLATSVRIPATIDLLIDSDLLACSAEYRSQCEIDLATLTGCSIALGDARAESGRDAIRLAASGLSPAALRRAHHAAEAFMDERAGPAWTDSPVPGRIGAMLTYATLLGTSPLHAVGFEPAWRYAELCPDSIRLARVYASHSWRITAPLRWMSLGLRAVAGGLRSAEQ